MSNVALVVAAGRGIRAGGDVPKQYRRIGGEMVLTLSIKALLSHPSVAQVCVVIAEDDEELYKSAISGIPTDRLLPRAVGGATRSQSVRNGLEQLATAAPDKVLIHDAARPFLSKNIIAELLTKLEHHDGAFPAIPVSDALWTADELSSVDRSNLLRAQTPQAFQFDQIRKAHAEGDPLALDDVEIALGQGLDVVHVPGDERNFKVTTAQDLEVANKLAGTFPDLRIGQGYDVHAFTTGQSVILNGIELPHDRRLKGHSDADVAMHAITDAIYGALAEGDIGQWFPPSEEEWKGASSDIFLKHAAERVKDRGYHIENIDNTIICEMPKIGPHAGKMRDNLARIMNVDKDRISVKATTSEQLGFTGRKEGIASMATVLLVRR